MNSEKKYLPSGRPCPHHDGI